MLFVSDKDYCTHNVFCFHPTALTWFLIPVFVHLSVFYQRATMLKMYNSECTCICILNQWKISCHESCNFYSSDWRLHLVYSYFRFSDSNSSFPCGFLPATEFVSLQLEMNSPWNLQQTGISVDSERITAVRALDSHLDQDWKFWLWNWQSCNCESDLQLMYLNRDDHGTKSSSDFTAWSFAGKTLPARVNVCSELACELMQHSTWALSCLHVCANSKNAKLAHLQIFSEFLCILAFAIAWAESESASELTQTAG